MLNAIFSLQFNSKREVDGYAEQIKRNDQERQSTRKSFANGGTGYINTKYHYA